MKRVLIVEDDPDLAAMLCKIFAVTGIEAAIAVDGSDALIKLSEATPDAIITDLNMPNLDGLELCRRLREGGRHVHVPVLVYTAVTSADPRLREMEAMPNVEIASKPMTARALIEKIATLLDTTPLRTDGSTTGIFAG